MQLYASLAPYITSRTHAGDLLLDAATRPLAPFDDLVEIIGLVPLVLIDGRYFEIEIRDVRRYAPRGARVNAWYFDDAPDEYVEWTGEIEDLAQLVEDAR